MKPLAILEHSPEVPPGYLADAVARSGIREISIRLYEGDPLPDLNEVGAIVSLGGVMGAYDGDEFPFLVEEKAYLGEAVSRGIPVLGICLGCQLLAEVLGGNAYLAEEPEVSFEAIELTAAAGGDSVVQELGTPVVSFHQDTWDLPPGAILLARSDRYPHAFRLGSALAIQSHPEASPAIVAEWVNSFGRDRLQAAGIDPDAVLEQVRAGADGNEARAAALFGAWLVEILEQHDDESRKG